MANSKQTRRESRRYNLTPKFHALDQLVAQGVKAGLGFDAATIRAYKLTNRGKSPSQRKP